MNFILIIRGLFTAARHAASEVISETDLAEHSSGYLWVDERLRCESKSLGVWFGALRSLHSEGSLGTVTFAGGQLSGRGSRKSNPFVGIKRYPMVAL